MASEMNDAGETKTLTENLHKEDFLEVLKLFSPGTLMRSALDDLLRARMGALIAVDKADLLKIVDGGFKINSRFSPQRLVELAKMDGAIVLSSDLKKILYANTLLIPGGSYKTTETGTRHKAAERTAKQFNTLVVAVSERKNKITVYFGEEKHVLRSGSEILRRATETLQILEKQKDIFDDILSHLNILEITDLTTTSDVCNVLQRIEVIRRVTDIVKKYLVELGKEGIIVSMRLKELTKNVNFEREMIVKDYFGNNFERIEELLNNMNFDFLLETPNISRILFEDIHEISVFPKGIRILSKAGIPEKERDLLVSNFNTLEKVFDADKEPLSQTLGRKSVDILKKDLDSLKEKILEGKKV